jgi:hypothetical protein
VGARCRECAKVKRLPTYEVTVQQYLKALGAGLGLAIFLGIVWGLLWRLLPFFFLSLLLGLILAACIGFAIGELISLSVNRKRGIALQIIAGVSLVFSYLISNIQLSGGMLILFVSFSLYDLMALALGTFIAVSRLR